MDRIFNANKPVFDALVRLSNMYGVIEAESVSSATDIPRHSTSPKDTSRRGYCIVRYFDRRFLAGAMECGGGVIAWEALVGEDWNAQLVISREGKEIVVHNKR